MTIEALAQAFDFTEATIRGVAPAQWTNPTPCSEWNVRELVNHTISAVESFAAIASGASPRSGQDKDFTVDDPGTSFRHFADTALAGWPAALDSTVHLGSEPIPGSVAMGMNLLDTLIHGWDIATATGQPSKLPVDAAMAGLTAARTTVTDQFRTFAGFAPPATVDEHASPTDQLIAFLGRQP